MPKFGIHHLILDGAITELQTDQDPQVQTVANILQNNIGLAHLGSIGPDMFFFAPDYIAVKYIDGAYKKIKGVVDKINEIKAIADQILQTALGEMPGGALLLTLLDQAQATADAFSGACQDLVTVEVMKWAGVAYEDYFRPPLQTLDKPKTETKWYWFDMLHYRHTGDFSKQLIKNATSDKQKAYAYGYLSHIAGDVVGHGFVNQIVGGPYRVNAQRHVTVESFMDTWKFHEHYNERVSEKLLTRLGIPEPPLDEEIIALLDKTFHDVFTIQAERPKQINSDGFLTKANIKETYRVLHDMLKMQESFNVERPHEPFTGVAQILEQILSDLFQPPPTPPNIDSNGGLCSWDDIFDSGSNQQECYDNFFKDIKKIANYMGDLINWGLDTLGRLANLLVSLANLVPVAILLAILYGIQLICYQVYQAARQMLALEGIIYPEPEDLNSSIGKHLMTTFESCGHELSKKLGFVYPKVRSMSLVSSNLTCPTGGVETPTTAPDFYPDSDTITPDEFIKIRPFNLDILKKYASARTPAATRVLEKNEEKIGNAIDMTKWMITTAVKTIDDANVFVNWNLDSDRGYGYKDWQADNLPNIDNGQTDSVTNEKWST